MEISNSANEINNAKINRVLLEGVSKAIETSVKPCKSSQLIKKESKGFNFSSRLVKVTEEDKIEKPRRTRNWKGRKAAERAKKQAVCRQAEVDNQKPHQTMNVNGFGCLDGCVINIEERIAELLTSLDCPSDIEDYLTPKPVVNFFEDLSWVQSLETQITGRVYYPENRGRPSSCFDILQQKIQEAKELKVEESKLLEKIDKFVRKISRKVKSKFVNRPGFKEFTEMENRKGKNRKFRFQNARLNIKT